MPGIQHFVGNTDEFPVLAKSIYFNHAGVTPLPKRAGDALRRYTHQAEESAYVGTNWYRDIDRFRDVAAKLIGAQREEIALVKNTSEGLSVVAHGIDWRAGDVIVTTAVEYPANVYPWMEVARRHGVKLTMVEEITREDGSRFVPLERLMDAIDQPRVRLLALSHVEFASGQTHDLTTLGVACRDRGILFCVDAIQSLGVMPVDVVALNIDYLSADGHKWLLGPEGAGIFYCRRALLESTRPLLLGWANVINDQAYGDYDFTFKPTAARFECGTHAIGNFLAFKASIELLLEIGIDAVRQRLEILGDRLCAGLREKGYTIVSPRDALSRSGIVSFVSRTHTHEELFRVLRRDHGIELALREGRLRASPHFYNTEGQIDRLIDAVPKS